MSARAEIYLDANAGAPLGPQAAQALRDLLLSAEGSLFANPSSVHRFGRQSRRLMNEARDRVARSFGADSSQVFFTSSGTEANQWAIRSVLEPLLRAGQKPHWLLTPVEHDSVLAMRDWLTARGGSWSFLPVDAEGRPRPESLAESLRPDTALLSFLWVNNETGVIADARELIRVARGYAPRLAIHLDAAQAWGKLPLELAGLGADFATFAGHKIGGLAGTGVLYVARPTALESLVSGSQERGKRGGTENLAGIVALGAAATAVNPGAWDAAVRPSRDLLEGLIRGRVAGARINGAGAARVGNTLNVSFATTQATDLVAALDLEGFAVSAGSACSSGVVEPSHVLLAMGRRAEEARNALRISLPSALDEATIERLVSMLARLRADAKAESHEGGAA